jgi:hypothetical protein
MAHIQIYLVDFFEDFSSDPPYVFNPQKSNFTPKISVNENRIF